MVWAFLSQYESSFSWISFFFSERIQHFRVGFHKPIDALCKALWMATFKKNLLWIILRERRQNFTIFIYLYEIRDLSNCLILMCKKTCRYPLRIFKGCHHIGMDLNCICFVSHNSRLNFINHVSINSQFPIELCNGTPETGRRTYTRAKTQDWTRARLPTWPTQMAFRKGSLGFLGAMVGKHC